MRKAIIGAIGLAVAGVIGLSGAASAADVYARGGSLKDEPVGTFLPTWAGLYIGGSVGYSWGDAENTFPGGVWSCCRDQTAGEIHPTHGILHATRPCESKDPDFAAKAAEVVGLYMAPPENAIVISVDEKPSI